MNSSKKLIQLYLDDQLDEADRLRVEQILQEDADARAELEAYQKIRQALKTTAVPAMEISQPDFLWSRVKAAVEKDETTAGAREKEHNPWWNWDFRWAFGGVTAVVFAALALSYLLWVWQGHTVSLPDFRKQGYSTVTVYTFDPTVYPAEYLSGHAGANVIWLAGVDAYEPAGGEKL